MWSQCFPHSSVHRQDVAGMLTKTIKLMRWHDCSLFCTSLDIRQINGAFEVYFVCLLLKMAYAVLKSKFYMWPLVPVVISRTPVWPMTVWLYTEVRTTQKVCLRSLGTCLSREEVPLLMGTFRSDVGVVSLLLVVVCSGWRLLQKVFCLMFCQGLALGYLILFHPHFGKC